MCPLYDLNLLYSLLFTTYNTFFSYSLIYKTKTSTFKHSSIRINSLVINQAIFESYFKTSIFSTIKHRYIII